MKVVHKLLGDNPTIWVFGYGSLLWKPDFRFKSKKVGYIKDYERRFYQGNVTFRGKPGQPGRVANLVAMKGSQAWGVAYEISGREEVAQVLQSLYTRESSSGGYVTMVTTFYPRDEKSDRNVTSLHRTSGSDMEHTSARSNEQGDVLHENQPSLDRSDLYFSYTRIDETSSEDNLTDRGYGTSLNKVDGFVNCETRDQLSLADISHSLDGNHKNMDSLLHYLHSVNSEKMSSEEHRPVTEASESSQSQLSSPDSSKSRSRKIEKTKNSPSNVQVLLYTATAENDLYLGQDDVTSMARQIINASGSAGSNVEYVTKTADYVRRYIPEDQDSHLFSLDAKVREEIYRQQARDPTRLRLGLADLIIDQHEIEPNSITGPVMAS